MLISSTGFSKAIEAELIEALNAKGFSYVDNFGTELDVLIYNPDSPEQYIKLKKAELLKKMGQNIEILTLREFEDKFNLKLVDPSVLNSNQENGVMRGSMPQPKTRINIDGISFTYDLQELIKYKRGGETDVYIVPDGVKTIGEGAFRGTSFSKIVLPDSIEHVGEYAFSLTGYPYIERHIIELPSKPINIDYLAFDPVLYYKFGGMKDVNEVYCLEFRYKDTTIPVELLGNWKVNSEEKKLAEFIETNQIGRKKSIFSDVKTSGYKKFMAFYLALIYKDPESTQYLLKRKKTLAQDAMYSHLLEFLNTELIEQLDTNPSISKTSQKVDLSKWAIKYLSDGACEIEKYKGKEKLVEIPSEYDGLPIISIGESAFSAKKTKACGEIEKIIVPEGIIVIGDNAFYDCEALVEISLPESLRQIGDEAFRYCHSLRIIKIPDGVKQIGDRAFSECRALKTIRVPDSATQIGTGVFFSCDQLEDVVLPAQVTTIPSGLLSCCTSIKKIVLGDDVTIIEENAFSGCDALEEVILDDSLKSIGRSAFFGCKNLKEIKLPDELTEIGKSAFSCCESLKQIDIPGKANINCSNNMLFQGCKSMMDINVHEQNENFASVDGVLFDKSQKQLISFPPGRDSYVVPDSVEVIGERAFYRCKNLRSISFSNNLREIGEDAFCLCENLNEVSLPITLEIIGEKAFAYSGITKIDVPDGVPEICNGAFAHCYYLESVILPASLQKIGWNCFEDCDDVRVYAPVGSYAEGYCINRGIALVNSIDDFEERELTITAEEMIKYKLFSIGGLSPLKYRKAQQIIESLGGEVKGFSVKSDYLIYDPKRPSSNLKQAKEANKKGKKIKLLTWDEFSKMVWKE